MYILVFAYILGCVVKAQQLSVEVGIHIDDTQLQQSSRTSQQNEQTTKQATQTFAAAAATHVVGVGLDDLLLFEPNHINAYVNDVVQFNFYRFNHTVTQSSLQRPCISSGIFDTGFAHNVTSSDTAYDFVAFTVRDLNPHWFFCRQTITVSHCHSGMVFGLNPGHDMQQFLENANPPASGSFNSARSLPRSTFQATGTALHPSGATGTLNYPAQSASWATFFNASSSSRTPTNPTITPAGTSRALKGAPSWGLTLVVSLLYGIL